MVENSSNFISHLNSVKSFQDFWPDDCRELSLADYKVLSTWYNVIGYICEDKLKISHLEKFTEEEVNFIKLSRIPFLSNPLSKGRYCDVLATSSNKHVFEIANMSLNCYVDVLSHYSEYDSIIIPDVIFSAVLTTLKYNKDKIPLKDIINQYFLDETIDEDNKRIVLCVLYISGFYKAQECQVIIDSQSSWLDITNNYDLNKTYFKHLLRISQATNKPTNYRYIIYHKLAENEEIIISQHPLDSFAVQELIAKAEYLEAGHWSEEAKECRKLITFAKENGAGIVSIRCKAEIPNIMLPQYSRFFIDRVNPFEIIAKEDELLPNFQLDIYNGNDGLPSGIRKTRIDYNGNPHPMNKSIEEQMQSYSNHYEMDTFAPMLIVMRDLIDNKSFTFTRLANYLKQTWIGKPRCLVNVALRQSQESWLDLLRPSLKMLCREIQKQLTKEGYKADFVCCLDSLTVKLEGCIRDIARRYGLRTIDGEHNELLLGRLLEQIDESIMPRKTILLLNSMLKPDGRNLRNNFAHGFSSLADYNFNNAFALLHCLLRISAVQM